MLSRPHKNSWSRSDRLAEFSFFRTLVKRRRRPARILRKPKFGGENDRWKPAAWTPWLWVK
jgi:hypothetical protein